MALLRDQKTAQMPLVQFTEKRVEVTVIMRTSSGSPSTIANSGDASDSGSGNSWKWWTLQRCNRQRHRQVLSSRDNPKSCRDDTRAVQGDEPPLQKRMPNIKKILKTLEIIHAQGQVPDIAKTDEIPQAQLMPRRCTTNSDAETVPNVQEIQIGMLQRSAVRERSGGYACCERQARAIQTRRRHRGPHYTAHRQDRWCSLVGEAPGYQ